MIIDIRYSLVWKERVELFQALLPRVYQYGDYGSHLILFNDERRLKVVVRDPELIPITISFLKYSLKKDELTIENILNSYDPPFALDEWLDRHRQVGIHLYLGIPVIFL